MLVYIKLRQHLIQVKEFRSFLVNYLCFKISVPLSDSSGDLCASSLNLFQLHRETRESIEIHGENLENSINVKEAVYKWVDYFVDYDSFLSCNSLFYFLDMHGNFVTIKWFLKIPGFFEEFQCFFVFPQLEEAHPFCI